MATSSFSRKATRHGSRGFTLLELMITLTVAAILLGVGVPSFVDMVRSNRAATNINELSTAFAIARSEAIRRGANVRVCRSSDGATCGASWADGWIVFVDDAATDTAPAGARRGPASLGRDAGRRDGHDVCERRGHRPRVGAVRAARRRADRGRDAAQLCEIELAGCSGEQQRTLELNTVGRASVARGTC